jgi:L-gulonate 3-dehydrogenase
VDVKNRVAIIGAGLIGRSWAIVFAGGAFDVALYDVGLDLAEKARTLVTQGLSDLAEQGLIDDPQTAAARVRVAANLADALDAVDLVQESLPESIETKRSIFSELDRLAAPEAILASSTSTIVASLFTQSLKGRHRCLVAHPVKPTASHPARGARRRAVDGTRDRRKGQGDLSCRRPSADHRQA